MRRSSRLGLVLMLGLFLAGPAAARGSDCDKDKDDDGGLPCEGETLVCDGEFSRVSVEEVVVPAGESCILSRSRVDGNVTVEEGASLVLFKCKVDGNVESKGAVDLDNSKVEGNVQIDGGDLIDVKVRENVQIASTRGVACEGRSNQVCRSSIQGDLQLDDNEAPFDIGCDRGNRVGGDLQVKGSNIPAEFDLPFVLDVRSNSVKGDLQFDDNTSAMGHFQILENRVRGDLQCDGNDPAPMGGENRVRGDAEGQCEGLERTTSSERKKHDPLVCDAP